MSELAKSSQRTGFLGPLRIVLAFGCGSAAGLLLGLLSSPPGLSAITGISAAVLGLAAAVAAVARKSSVWPSDFPWPSLVLAAAVAATGTAAVVSSVRDRNAADRVAGVLPFSDAESYYDLMVQWPQDRIDAFNARRPVNSAVNALEGAICGGRLRDILLLRAMLLSASIAVLGTAIARHAGWLAAGATCALLMHWSLPFAASCLTEVSGITLASASTALLLWAAVTGSPIAAGGAAASAGLAFSLRPGNPAWPVLVALTAARSARKGLRVAIVATALSVAMAIGLPRLLAWNLSEPGSETNSNMSHVVLGIAAGSHWREAEGLVAAEAADRTEAEQSSIRYRKALELVRTDPGRMIAGAAAGLTDAIGARGGLVDQVAEGLGFRSRLLGWTAVATLGLAVAFGARARQPLAVAAAVAAICFVAGAPFLWTSGKWRANAALFPGLALAIACVPHAARRLARRSPVCDVGLEGSMAPPAGGTWAIGAAACIAAVPLVGAAFAVLPRDVGAESPRPWARIDFRQQPQSAGRWTSATSAACSVRDLEAWARKRGFEELARFVERNGQQIIACRREPGEFVIELRPGAGIATTGEVIEYTFRALEQGSNGGQ